MIEPSDTDIEKIIKSNYSKLCGALMRLKRVQKSLTHDDLAKKADISRPTLSKMESAREIVKDSTFQIVANALGIDQAEVNLLKEFSAIFNPDDGHQIVISNEFIEALGTRKISTLFDEAAEIASKAPDTSKNKDLSARTVLTLAILKHHAHLPRCKPTCN